MVSSGIMLKTEHHANTPKVVPKMSGTVVYFFVKRRITKRTAEGTKPPRKATERRSVDHIEECRECFVFVAC